MEKINKIADKILKLAPGGFYGLLSVLIGCLFVCFSYAHFPGYDMTRYDVSVLGIGPGLSAPLFNIGVILIGIIALPFFIYLGKILQQENDNEKIFKLAKELSIIGCLSLSLIGCFPVINIAIGIIHAFLALLFFVSMLIYLILFSRIILKNLIFSRIHAYFSLIVAGIITFYLITRWSIVEWLVFFSIGFWIVDISIYTLYKKIEI